MAAKYTQMTLKKLRELGYTAQVVERWCSYSRRRVDLFGVVDIVAAHPGAGVLFVQSTSGNCHAKRKDKIEKSDEANVLVAAGGKLELWSWAKRGPRGKRKIWTLRREAIPGEPSRCSTSPPATPQTPAATICREP